MLITVAVFSLKLLHLGFVFFVLLGWLVPVRSILLLHLATVPLMILQWRLNRGTCVLTNLERLIQGKAAYAEEAQGQFIKQLLKTCYSELPSDSAIRRGLYLLVVLVWLSSAGHLLVLFLLERGYFLVPI